MTRKIALFAVFSLLLDAGTAFAWGKKKLEMSETGTVIPAKRKAGKISMSFKDDVVGDLSHMKADKRVSLPFFRVNFVTNSKKASTAKSLGLPSEEVSATKIIEAGLDGVSDKTFQEIADAAYADALKRLGEAGFEVVPAAEVAKVESFAGLKSEYPDHDDAKSAFTATGTKFPGLFAMGTGPAKVMAGTKAGVLLVDYTLNFAAFGAQASNQIDHAEAEVQFGQVAHAWGKWTGMLYEGSKCGMMGCEPKKLGDASLGQATYSKIAFGTFNESTSKGTKAANAISGAASLLGGRSKRSKSQYTLAADEAKYKEAALEALIQANKRLAEKLAG